MIKSLKEVKKGITVKEFMKYIVSKGYMFEKATDPADFSVDCDYEIDVVTRYMYGTEYHKVYAIKNNVVVAQWGWNW